MKNKNIFLFLFILMCSWSISYGVIVTATNGLGPLQDSSGAAIGNGNLVELGYFSPGFDTGTITVTNTYDSLITSEAWNPIGSAPNTLTSNFLGFDGSFLINTEATGISGNQIYIMAFNSANPASSTEWGLATTLSGASAPFWLTAGDSPPDNTNSIDLSQIDTALVGSIVGETTTLQFAVIPEPSTYLLLLGGIGVLFFIRHRK